MEVLFESRVNLAQFQGQLHFVQWQPHIHPEPVVRPDSAADGTLVQIYGTVLREGGVLRMWYQAWPRSVSGKRDVSAVGYAESEDGIQWRKPPLPFQAIDDQPSNLLDLGMGIPSVWIDPDSPPSHRYRATGVINAVGTEMCNPQAVASGYFTAHSADGIGWQLDSPYPRWYSLDDINSTYHPQQRRGLVMMKYSLRVGSLIRRSLYAAEYRDGVYSDPVAALVPDEYDDITAMQHGFRSVDYYQFTFLPAGSGTIGFLLNFRHHLPYTYNGNFALYGASDVTLVYQEGAHGCWTHVPGRPNFIDRTQYPWMEGFITTASCPVEMGDEHWLYFSSRSFSHGFGCTTAWEEQERWLAYRERYCVSGIGIARWPKWRLFGFEADPEGGFNVHLGELTTPCKLRLNFRTKPGGRIRVGVVHAPAADLCDPMQQDWRNLSPLPGRTVDDCLPLIGDCIAQEVAWKEGSVIQSKPGYHVVLRIEMEVAGVYAYELVAE